MPDKVFLDKLLQKLKIGDSRSIHLNALPGNFARLDIYDLVNIEPSLHLKFLQLLLSKPTFSISITIDPAIIDQKKKEEADIIRKMIRRLNLMYYQEQDEYLEHGTRTFGFGYPLVVKRDPNNPAKIIKAPLFIWYLDLQKDTHRNNTWTISRREDEHALIFNEMLRSHLESAEQVSVEDLAAVPEEDMIDETALLEACRTLMKKLGGKQPEDGEIAKILPGSDRNSIEKITGDSPWIRWSGIFGLYKTQKQSIIKDIEDLKNSPAGMEWNTVYDSYQRENVTPVLLDPSQESVLNSLGATNRVIIQGPPGTGKSQTLTAIITNALYNKSTCLVVCEKRTALEVIQHNLEQLGLGNLCVLIDDIYTDRKKVVERVRAITDNPLQPPALRVHEYEELHHKQQALKKELNRHLGIVNNRFFGDDNWLDMVGWHLSLKSQVESALKNISTAPFELDYKEYRELLPVIEEGETLWIKGGNKPLSTDLPEWFFRLPAEQSFHLLKEWINNVNLLLADHETNTTLYGKDYLLTSGWTTKKTSLMGWLVRSWGNAGKARERFLEQYNKILEDWGTQPFSAEQLRDIHSFTTLEQAALALKTIVSALLPVLGEQHSHASYLSWRQYLAGLTPERVSLLQQLADHQANDWLKAFSYWYSGKVLDKMASLYVLNETTDEVATELEVTEQQWRRILNGGIRYTWFLQQQETLKKRDITFIKNLYNLRKNKQFGVRNSLRKIIHTDLEFFTSMFPVVLVNPVVCSSVLPLKDGIFDIVLLDEASQLRLEDTFPALLRGKSKVISGDKHQMPPSGFFQSQVAFMDLGKEEEAEEDNTTMVSNSLAESESLLEFAGDTDYSFTYLDFHYRSRHPDLIRFSNAAFYGSRLVPMPEQKDYTAIEFHAVNGQYDGQGTNRQEAEAVVSFLYNTLLPADNSLFPGIGVGTFNINQRNLIWDLLLERAYGDEAASARLDALLQAGLFVKNLENIQGDERDIMILSTTFGPDKEGKFRQLFGPLTQAKGYQLLNVIVTRAKDKMHIFSSFPDSYIASYLEGLQEKGNTGKGILYAYLAYARAVSAGNIVMKDAILSSVSKFCTERSAAGRLQADKDRFRVWLKGRLDQLSGGYHMAEDHPFGGFILDLAILDEKGRILLAIECEGATDHGSAEAYRYHLYRRDMLNRYHIPAFYAWSYNFLKNPEGEILRLEQAIAL